MYVSTFERTQGGAVMLFTNYIPLSRIVVPVVLVSFAIILSQISASAQSASFARTDYPILGNNHIVADLNGDGIPDLAGTGVKLRGGNVR